MPIENGCKIRLVMTTPIICPAKRQSGAELAGPEDIGCDGRKDINHFSSPFCPPKRKSLRGCFWLSKMQQVYEQLGVII